MLLSAAATAQTPQYAISTVAGGVAERYAPEASGQTTPSRLTTVKAVSSHNMRLMRSQADSWRDEVEQFCRCLLRK
jgi:hypothetical protein